MRAQRWGKIVNVGSMGGRLTFPGGGPLPRDQARARGDLRRAALRAARLRHRRDPARAGADHDRVRRRPPPRSMADVGAAPARIPTRTSTRPWRGHRGRLRRPDAPLGAGPERVAKVIERAITRRRPPARITITPSAKLSIADTPAAERPRVGRGDAPAVPPAGLRTRRCSARIALYRHRYTAACGLTDPAKPGSARAHAVTAAQRTATRRGSDVRPRSPGRSRRRSPAACSIVVSSPTNSAIVSRAHAAHDAGERPDDSWSVRETGRRRMKSPSIFRWLKGRCLRYWKRAEAGAEVVEREIARRAPARRRRSSRALPCRRSRRSR